MKTRMMEATVKAFATGEQTLMAVKARSIEEATGKAIMIFGLDAVVKTYDPWTGDVWENPLPRLLAMSLSQK